MIRCVKGSIFGQEKELRGLQASVASKGKKNSVTGVVHLASIMSFSMQKRCGYTRSSSHWNWFFSKRNPVTGIGFGRSVPTSPKVPDLKKSGSQEHLGNRYEMTVLVAFWMLSAEYVWTDYAEGVFYSLSHPWLLKVETERH